MSNINWESIKSALRLVMFAVISWFITEIVRQVDLVPESWLFKVYVFTFTIPLRNLIVLGLMAFQQWLDKFLHEKKNEGTPKGMREPGGLLPF